MAALEPRKKYRKETPAAPPPTAELKEEKNPVQAAAAEAIKKRLDEMSPDDVGPASDKAEAPAPADKNENSVVASLQQRLREMEAAEANARANLVAEAQAQVARQQAEEMSPAEQFEAAIAELPERVKGWYRNNPAFLFEPEQAAKLQYVHHVVRREVGEEGSDAYFDRMEQMLGLRQAARSNGNGHAGEPTAAAPSRPPPQQRAAPAQQMQRQSAPVSAPPTRDAPSMSSGRPLSDSRIRLTPEQVQIALASKLRPEESDHAALERYAKNLLKMNELKRQGVIQDGR